MSDDFEINLDESLGAFVLVQFTARRRTITNYSVVLVVRRAGETATVRVYDGSHGHNEMHRYARAGGKQVAEIFHDGTLGEGMRAALASTREGYEQMIDGWDRA